MQLTHMFTVPASPEQAWEILTDINRIGPCLPGATIESATKEEFAGRVDLKIGPARLTFQGVGCYSELDRAGLRAVVEARGTETRGNGSANATIAATLHPAESGTLVNVITDLGVTGRTAQYGRGIMSDIGGKLLADFADRLARELRTESAEPADGGVRDDVQTAPSSPSSSPAQLDLGRIALASMLGRIRVPAAVVAALLLGWHLGRARRERIRPLR